MCINVLTHIMIIIVEIRHTIRVIAKVSCSGLFDVISWNPFCVG